MNIYILTDLEGISGIYSRDQLEPTKWRFDEARRLMTREVDLCAAACKALGAEKVYVRDVHGGSYTLLWDQLSDAVDRVVCGWTGNKRMVGLEDCDAVILLGYHAMARNTDALLNHTMILDAYRDFCLNGVSIGEIGIDAAIAGEQGTPVIMVSGSTMACAEAKSLLPWVTTVEVKQDAGHYGAQLLPQAETEQRLRDGIAEAIRRFKNGECAPYTVTHPATFRLECAPTHNLPNAEEKPYMTVIDEHTYEVTGDTVEQALFRVF